MTAGSDVRAAFTDPAENLAFDEALLRVAPESPVLWLWRNPVCVVVGRGQRIAREVRVPECERDGVPVLRRASGGGTVFHDPGNLNVTLVLPGPADRPLEALGQVMSAAVDHLGLVPRIGDRGLFVGEAKLCGFAVFRTKTGLLAHSTLLVETSAALVGRYLTSAPPDPRPLDSHRSPVASLAEHGIRPGFPAVEAAVRAAASQILGTFVPRPPTSAERDRQRALLHTRYHYPSWHADGAQRAA
ncbi:lipoate--protein ligase family protein [Amycolatopsis sp. SID8362]|uniref:lipoate--protein ligase family protein n=1 Tax=Amycolatopsis sp. SID8362 TaxID=2690346 RepID=UPI0013696A92|nr:lipoate--protein ligase family protein [Amycolatopsis sp. SID8362]NBH08884.1 lipoate--protein ligase family protein [Amycolatopsis sp. SID8362]NED45576.1 lipoate--protein ligase family protein [Amycolatopsis sp. SID8362]